MSGPLQATITGRHPLTVEYGQFTIRDLETEFTDPGAYRTTNGLLCTQIPSGTAVLTGTRWGWVDLEWQYFPAQPPLILEGWDEVVEVSMEFDEGQILINSPALDDTSVLFDLPDGEGWYRVRVHAAGRDAADVAAEFISPPVEHHLVQIWPAPRTTDAIHKTTDRFGRRRLITNACPRPR